MEEALQLIKIAEKYNALEIWPISDKWHTYTHNKIDNYIKAFFNKFPLKHDHSILNAGSGGNNYGLNNLNMIHVDIAKEKIKKHPGYILSSVEKMPLENNSIDIGICVGSVLNYCNPERAISEFTRVLKSNSILIIEFEKTNSFDLIATKDFNKERTIITTFYNKRKEKLWVYHESTILNILNTSFSIIDYNRFHLFSPLIYRLTKNDQFSASFAKFDGFFRIIPVLNKYSSNIILTCQKRI